MISITDIDIDELRPHSENETFFTRTEGEEFERLKQSIKELGILTPLRVAKDMTIISGHQRYRAAQELGLSSLPAVITNEALSDDDMRMQLIASNFQRIKSDPIKQAKWIAEYERLRGVRQGSAGTPDRQNVARTTQADIAKELGVDAKTLQRTKKLNDLIPEFATLVSEGKVNKTDATNWLSRLDKEQQRQLYNAMPEAEKYSKGLLKSFVQTIQEGHAKGDELRQILKYSKELADEVTSRKGCTAVSDDGTVTHDAGIGLYESLLSDGLHLDIIDKVEYLLENKEQIKKFEPEILRQPVKDVVFAIDKLSEVLSELIATMDGKLENPAEAANILEALGATYTKLSEQLRK